MARTLRPEQAFAAERELPIPDCSPEEQGQAEGHFQDAHEAVRLLSGKWVFAVLVQLAEGPQHHNELARSTGVAENKPLDRTLHRLLRMRLVDRTVHNVGGSAPRVRYQLTPRGHSVLPIIDELAGWWQAAELPEH
ncbi:winged helix-turn-helix transcriptional regulator [Kitasatospora sp. NPDC006697]|uniref:winged helix-turn-helix transcriptional regulator n=1 Tax=Kitasatospora sp. NPDC006697 TaxID=3364020 RepID=UPI0036C97343